MLSQTQQSLAILISADFRSETIPNDDQLAIQLHFETLKSNFFSTETVHSPIPTNDFPQPPIVLSPSDILTAFNALYPRLRHHPNLPPLPPPSRLPPKWTDDSPKRPSSEYLRPILKRSPMFELNESSESSQSETEIEVPAVPEETDLFGLAVKAAIDEMRRRLGSERCMGERHPCDEAWAVVYVSEDGLSLSCVPEFEDVDETPNNGKFILSKEEDLAIETALLKVADSSGTLDPFPTPPVAESAPTSPTKPSRYRDDLISLASPLILPSRPSRLVTASSPLLSAVTVAAQRSYARADYIEAQSFQHAHGLLKSIPPGPFTSNDYAAVIGTTTRKIQSKGNNLLVLIRTREVWFSHLLRDRTNLECMLINLSSVLSKLRCKIWYATHVRESKVFQRAKDVCEALYKMKTCKAGMTGTAAPAPGLKRNSSGASLHRSSSVTRGQRFIPSRQSFDGFTFSGRPQSLYNVSVGMASDEWFDILAAAKEQGGPHKLSDYQVEITQRWLDEHASENFCRGEEIIHRFIAEVDDVMRRLVPESADEMTAVASTFWESDEFLEDAKEFGLLEYDRRFSRKEDGFHNHGRRRSVDIPSSSSGVDLLGMLTRSRGKTLPNDTASDTRSVRSSHSRAASLTVTTRSRDFPEVFIRPNSSQSNSFPPPPSPALSFFSKASPMARTPTINVADEKAANQFLDVTRQRVLSLLLSDLGAEIWAGGSETDEWFSDGLADTCLQRHRENRKMESGRPKKVANIGRGLRRPSLREFSFGEEPPTPPLSRETSEEGSAPGKSSEAFDFKNAYRQLLRRFSVHPAPHEKLKALYELERLIHASFVTFSNENAHFTASRSSLDTTRRVSSSSAVGTDDLIDEIQRLLRDPSIRPKTLFRDLSFVSSFITPVTLTHHGEGKVFWDIGLAASAMKSDVVSAMVGWYEEIMAGNVRTSGRRREPAGMKDAARMLVIAACEGNAVGQRELALLHLSHPELVPLTTFPLTRPADTFQRAGGRERMDRDKYDPDRIALATHWFKLASKNGDKYAKNVEGHWLGSKNI
jgi:hypothetical protein